MSEILEILKYILPSLIVFFTAYLIIKRFIENEQKKLKLQLATENERLIDPIRLQAYERLVLFLERISPESLIIRINKAGMTSKDLQSDMLTTIRIEFEHNLSQQVYISHEAWEIVKSSRSNLIKIINQCADKVDPRSPSIELSKCILEGIMEIEKPPTQIAIDFLKKELHELYF